MKLTPADESTSPYFSTRGAKKTDTAWPKMIGSDTFIIVAFRWSETIKSSAFADSNSDLKKERSLPTLIADESMTSSASSGVDSLSTCTSPPFLTSSIRTLPVFDMTQLCSEP